MIMCGTHFINVFRFPQLAKIVPIIPVKIFKFKRFILLISPYKGVILKMTKKGEIGKWEVYLIIHIEVSLV